MIKHFVHGDVVFEECQVVEGTPRVYITPDGKYKFPSMTSVLSVLHDDGLQKWIDRVGQEEADKIANAAAHRGTSLHKYCEDYLNNGLDMKSLSGQAKVLFNRIKRHLDQFQLVIGTEVPLWNTKLEYAGRTDAIVLVNDQLTVIDYKNSRRPIDLNASFGRRKLFKYQLQVYGYAKALECVTGLKATHGMILVANHLTSNTDKFRFALEDKYFYNELRLVTDAYYHKADISNSLFFKL